VQALYKRVNLDEVVPKAVLEEKTAVILYGLKILYYASGRPVDAAGDEQGEGQRFGGIMWHRDVVRFLMRLVASFVVKEPGTGGKGGGGEVGVGEMVDVAPFGARALGLEELVTREYPRKTGSVMLISLQGQRRGFAACEHAVTNRCAWSMGQLILDLGLAPASLAHLSMEKMWRDPARCGRFQHEHDAPLLTMPVDLWNADRPTMLNLLMRTQRKWIRKLEHPAGFLLPPLNVVLIPWSQISTGPTST
jgi:hypothetical protein